MINLNVISCRYLNRMINSQSEKLDKVEEYCWNAWNKVFGHLVQGESNV